MHSDRFSIKRCLLLLAAVLFLGVAARPLNAHAADQKLGKVRNIIVRNWNKKVCLMWTKNKKADGYVILQQDSTGEFLVRKSIKRASKTRTVITGLTNNKTYKFKIAAYKVSDGKKRIGKLSDELTAKPYNTNTVKKIHAYYYKGTMRSTVRVKGVTFTEGQAVTVSSKNSDGKYVSIYSQGNTKIPILYKGKIYNVPASTVRLSDFITNYKKAYSTDLAEKFVNYMGFKSPTKYFIWVSTYGQHFYLFEGSQYKWKLKKHCVCSTGLFEGEDDRITPTQLGFGFIRGREDTWYQWSEYQGFYYAVRMHPGGWFHSWLYYNDGTSYGNSVGSFGKPASHGCVRLKMDVIKWVWSNVPDNTTFLIN